MLAQDLERWAQEAQDFADRMTRLAAADPRLATDYRRKAIASAERAAGYRLKASAARATEEAARVG